jgi:hypothetical protein
MIEGFLNNKLYMNDPSMFRHLEAIFEKGKKGPPKKKKEPEKKIKKVESPKQEIVEKPPTPIVEPEPVQISDEKEGSGSASPVPSREKYIVDMSERPQDPGSVN